MKTQFEIVEQIIERSQYDFFGFEWHEYLRALDFEHVKQFLKEDQKEEDWKADLACEANILAQMKEYMPFAWEKANNCRGISALRSIMHYEAWLWMLGEEDLAKKIYDYEYYGKDELREICFFLGIDANQYDNGIRVVEG